MAFKDVAKKELRELVDIKISKGFALSGTSLASMESLSLPLVCIMYSCLFSLFEYAKFDPHEFSRI